MEEVRQLLAYAFGDAYLGCRSCLSEKREFEDAASKTFISEPTDIASVQEKEGWDELTSVMSRPWNGQAMSVTFKNLVVGLGGQEFPLPDSLKSHLKNPYDYQGLYLNQHFR